MIETSNVLRVNRIVLTMRADEPDVDHTIGIVDPDHDPIFVACNVEDGAAVLENAGAADIPFDVRRLRPVSLSHLTKPCHHRFTGVGNPFASVKKSLDRAKRNHSHRPTVPRSQFGTKPYRR